MEERNPNTGTREARPLLEIGRIFHEPSVEEYARGREILSRFPDAERVEVPSHWNIEGLHGNEGLVGDWLGTKRGVLVLGVKKSLACRPNGRSADFIAPSHSNGCAMACAYCYVPRRKGYANPITTFVNIEGIKGAVERHARKQGLKMEPNPVDPIFWVYDIGENGDCSVDATVSDNVKDIVDLFKGIPNAKASFATKCVNRDLLGYEPQGKTRIRFSLMPEPVSKVVDVRTSRIRDRIAAINDFVEAGYEVHVNFSPVIVYEGWRADYRELFSWLDDALSPEAKAQLACEVIFLTHNEALHEVNLGWHPKAEDLLWTPGLQERKVSENGAVNVRYARAKKGKMVKLFKAMLAESLPYCKVRYAF